MATIAQMRVNKYSLDRTKEKIVVFTIYGHGGHLVHVTRILHIHIGFFVPCGGPKKYLRKSSILFYFGPLKSVRIFTASNIVTFRAILLKGKSWQRSGTGAIRKRFPLQKPRWEKTKQSGTYTMKTYRKPNEQLYSQQVATQLPKRSSKILKTYIRHQQRKNVQIPKHKTKRTTTEVSPWNDHLYKITGGLKSILHGHNLTLSFCNGS